MLEYEQRKNIIILDTETTGLNPATDELLQLAIIDREGNTLYHSYLRPTRTNSWPDAQSIHGITPEMVANAPTIDEELPKIQAIIQRAEVIIGYNQVFDMQFLAEAGCCFDHLYEDGYGWHTIDLMELFAAVYGDWHPYFQSYTWQKLTVAAAYYDYEWGSDKAHGALADSRATLHIWNSMLAQGDVQLAEQRIIDRNK